MQEWLFGEVGLRLVILAIAFTESRQVDSGATLGAGGFWCVTRQGAVATRPTDGMLTAAPHVQHFNSCDLAHIATVAARRQTLYYTLAAPGDAYRQTTDPRPLSGTPSSPCAASSRNGASAGPGPEPN